MEQVPVALDHDLEGELGVGAAARGMAHLLPQAGMSAQCLGGAGKRFRVGGGDHEAGGLVLVDVGDAGGEAAADDRLAAGHGFHLHQAEGFVGGDGRQHEDVAGVEQRREPVIVNLAPEPDPVGDAEVAGELGEFGAEGPVPTSQATACTLRRASSR